MNQDNFGKFIKDIRKKHNLTQKQLADKYHVTYQAVSKWENGINMPDTALMKQMSKDFNVSIEDMLDGEINVNNKKNNKLLFIIGGLLIVSVIILLIILVIKHSDDGNFNFKTLNTTCGNFTISGSIAYNDKKSSIYITNIEYCGEENKELYKTLECVLYESNDDIERKISSYKYDDNKSITLNEFLDKVTITVDDYKKTCKDYSENSLYLSVNATNEKGIVTTYTIPVSLGNSCSK